MLVFPGPKRYRLLLLVAIFPLTAAAPAEPWPDQVAWTSYLHEGPGKQYRVIDELDPGSPVEVLSCAGGWCSVLSGDRPGFLPDDMLVHAVVAPEGKPPAAACVDAVHTGYGAGRVYSYCPE